MYFIYGGQRTITILSSAKYIFRNADELHGLQYVIFACLMWDFFAMLVVVCNNTKLEKLTNNILKELHKRIMQGSFVISFLSFGISLFCMMAFCIGSLIINNNYYGKHAINFAYPFVLFLSFPYLIHKCITILCTQLKGFPKSKIHAAIIMLLIIAAAIIIPCIFNKKKNDYNHW